MWCSTSIDRKKTNVSTTLRFRVPTSKRVAAIGFAALLAVALMAQALSGYEATWSGLYPVSSSDTNAENHCVEPIRKIK